MLPGDLASGQLGGQIRECDHQRVEVETPVQHRYRDIVCHWQPAQLRVVVDDVEVIRRSAGLVRVVLVISGPHLVAGQKLDQVKLTARVACGCRTPPTVPVRSFVSVCINSLLLLICLRARWLTKNPSVGLSLRDFRLHCYSTRVTARGRRGKSPARRGRKAACALPVWAWSPSVRGSSCGATMRQADVFCDIEVAVSTLGV